MGLDSLESAGFDSRVNHYEEGNLLNKPSSFTEISSQIWNAGCHFYLKNSQCVVWCLFIFILAPSGALMWGRDDQGGRGSVASGCVKELWGRVRIPPSPILLLGRGYPQPLPNKKVYFLYILPRLPRGQNISESCVYQQID